VATNRSFQAMLNEYLPYSLLKEEIIKRDYILTNIENKSDWNLEKGEYIIYVGNASDAISQKLKITIK